MELIRSFSVYLHRPEELDKLGECFHDEIGISSDSYDYPDYRVVDRFGKMIGWNIRTVVFDNFEEAMLFAKMYLSVKESRK